VVNKWHENGAEEEKNIVKGAKANVFLNTVLLAAVFGFNSCGSFSGNSLSLSHTSYGGIEPAFNMTCTKPIEINGDLTFPCGKCMSCRVQRTQEWSIRLMDEASAWESSIFVTLTYSEEELPKDQLVSKRDLQLFLKRLRKSYPTPLKYYASGEYGEKTDRPHYHLIIFGMKLTDQNYIETAWNKGRIDVGTVTIESCRYVASYIQKKLYKKPTEKNSTVFSLQSQVLGLTWAKQNHKQLQQQEKTTHYGVPMGIPRYYVKKLELDLSKSQNKRVQKVDEELALVQNQNNDIEIFDINLRSKVQADKNIRARTSLKEKKL